MTRARQLGAALRSRHLNVTLSSQPTFAPNLKTPLSGRLAIGAGGLGERVLDAVVAAGFSHPSRGISNGVVVEPPVAPQLEHLMLYSAIALIGLVDPGNARDFGLVVRARTVIGT